MWKISIVTNINVLVHIYFTEGFNFHVAGVTEDAIKIPCLSEKLILKLEYFELDIVYLAHLRVE